MTFLTNVATTRWQTFVRVAAINTNQYVGRLLTLGVRLDQVKSIGTRTVINLKTNY